MTIPIIGAAELPRLPGCAVLPPLERPREPPSKFVFEEPTKRKTKHSSQGRFLAINAFIDTTMASLTNSQRSVWLILWRDTKPNGLAETSQADLARRAGVTDRMVRHALTELIRRGLVRVVKRGSLQRGRSVYRVRPLEKWRWFRCGNGLPNA